MLCAKVNADGGSLQPDGVCLAGFLAKVSGLQSWIPLTCSFLLQGDKQTIGRETCS